ncbi:hypothetical protein Tco_0375773 [Tanacetum coccineum]
MTTLKFADTHNMVAFLAKPAESEGFEQIVDFLNAHTIKYALTINPTIYTSCIEQFWATVKVKTVNGEVQLQALVDGKKIIITKSIVRRDLQLEDAEGVDCLPNATIFEQLTLMGYEKISQKLTFYKAFFSPQWKFLIHTILQCLSSKTTAWNEFSSTMASAIICLATNQKAATTASSLEAEQDNGNIIKTRSKATPNEVGSQGITLGDGPRRQETMGDTIAQTRSENAQKLGKDVGTSFAFDLHAPRFFDEVEFVIDLDFHPSDIRLRLFLFPYVEDLRMRILLMFNTISSIRIKFLYNLIHLSGSLFFNIIIIEDNNWKLVK